MSAINGVSVVVPVYNEEAIVGQFAEEVVKHVDMDWEVVFVDDGSSDGTAEILSRVVAANPIMRVERHPVNRGLGAALRTGVGAARGAVIVTMDADMSHPFGLMRELVVSCADADAAFGSRFVPGGGMVGVPWFRKAISRVGNVIFRLVYWSSIHDLTTGLRAYRSGAVADLPLQEDGFAIQLEISVHLLARGASVNELPLVLANRAGGESKMKYVRVVPRYLATMVRLVPVRWFPSSDRTASTPP